jgi:hypothetical protein
MKVYPKSFRPKWSFVGSIPDALQLRVEVLEPAEQGGPVARFCVGQPLVVFQLSRQRYLLLVD